MTMSSFAARIALGVAVAALIVSPRRAEAQASLPDGYVVLGASVSAPALDVPITLDMTAPLRDVVGRIAALANVGLAFDDSLPGLSARVTVHAQRVQTRVVLERALAESPLQALVSATGQIVLVRRAQRTAHASRVFGTVRDSLGGSIVDGARVELIGTRFSAVSRDSGQFSMGDVPAGRYAVRVTRIGFEPLTIESLRVPDDLGDGALHLRLHRVTVALSAIVVTPGYFGLLQPTLATPQSLSREQLETIPQIGEDIYRAVARLPGVTADDFSAKFSVRGGSGDELYVSLDGLELVEPFHLKDFGGAFSIVDIQALGTASLTTGGFGVEYGDRLTGVFTLQTADPRTDRTRTSLGVSLMNARATSQGGFAGGKGGWLVSARPGFLDLALKFTSISDSVKPRYYDLFAKAQYDLGAGRVAIHVLRANDTFNYLSRNEPNISSSYGSNFAWLTWDNPFGSRLREQSVLSFGGLRWRRHGDHSDGGLQTALINDERSLDRIGLRQDWTFDATSRLMLKWGVDAKRESASYDYFAATRADHQEGTGNVAALDTTLAVSAPNTNKLALYLATRVRVLRALTVEVGVRSDRDSHVNESIVTPRLNVSWQPTAETTIRGAWGKYSQSQPLFSLQAEDGVTEFAKAERGEQRILGVERVFARGLTARVEAYERRVTNARARYENVGGDTWVFPEILWDRVRIDRTASLDRGLELQLSRGAGQSMDWSASYALARSIDSIGGRAVPRNFDQRHAVHLDWSVHPRSNAWRLSVGGLWHSGWPYTPTILTVDTVSNTPTRFAVQSARAPGEINSMRLRSYHRIDARWTRYFDTSRGRMSVFGEVYNLLDTVNPRGIWKNVNVNGRGVIVSTGEITQWPRLPIAGFTWEF